MKEFAPYRLDSLFSGDRILFNEVFGNPLSVVCYDGDGILLNSPKVVLENFTCKTGINTHQKDIDDWNYLAILAKKNGYSTESANNLQSGWYDPELLKKAGRYLYMRPVVQETVKRFGRERNFVLTARMPELMDSTRYSLRKNYSDIPVENLLIRDETNVGVESSIFKSQKLREKAELSPWVILIDDTSENIQAAIEAKIDNLLLIYVPLGRISVDFKHPQVVTIKRFPEESQSMYPLMDAIGKVSLND